MNSSFEVEFIKVLSANDIGVTNSHQAGFLIPKRIAKMNYFPVLDNFTPNPRKRLIFYSTDVGHEIECNFIYYNGKSLGFSTRSEYRLTGLTEFIREMNFRIGDQVAFGRQGERLTLTKMPEFEEVKSLGSNNEEKIGDIIPFVSINGWKIRERKAV